ncbi:unnamed protein product [Adineta steineri]|uniref:Tripeptidyl-peptidase 1 n=1 Tax=Adineta steineri TaxID=433720 RepID=A0A819RV09_9BILA|nr:unnamed protein product [Adineta steineri]CAF4046474.1 unnamed protein product [Adineta steineri]
MVLKQDPKAVRKLDEILWKITDPDSSEYQNWLTRSKINKILTLDYQVLTAVKYWLWKQSFRSVRLIGTDVFEIVTTIRHVQKLFSAQFRTYKNSRTGKTIHRTHDDVCWANEISHLIDFFLGLNDDTLTNSKPTGSSKKRILIPNDGNARDAATTQIIPMIVPPSVRLCYKIPDVLKTGLESNVSQGALEFEGQNYSEEDLQIFCEFLGIPFKPIHTEGINDQSNPGIETMLDIEQMMAINPLSKIWYFNDDVKNIISDGILIKMLTLTESDKLPQIFSISYGIYESNLCVPGIPCDENVVDPKHKYFIRTNIEFMKLALRGITVLASSGDDGANDYFSNCTNKVFNPTYPASSPFVTSVGATTLVNVQYNALQDQPLACSAFNPPLVCAYCGDEIAVSVNDPFFTDFTSGGGFSNFAPQPSYQKHAVDRYFLNEQYYLNEIPEMYPPSSMYNRKGRAYPDVAALGVNAFTVANDSLYLVGGTSMSSPLWAGIVSILNSRSIKITGKTLGFLNPLLYKMAKECPECFNDITVGNNKCTSTICTDQCKGFQAACGWDPVTGLGTPNVENILKYITELCEKKMKKTEYN